MSKQPKYAPKHKAPGVHRKPTKVLRNTLVISSVAVLATGATIGGGVLGGGSDDLSAVSGDLAAVADRPAASPDSVAALGGSSAQDSDASASAASSQDSDAEGLTAAQLAERTEQEASREDRRQPLDPSKEESLDSETGEAVTVTDKLSDDDPRDIAKAMLGDYGWGSDQFGCLDSLWTKESNWNIYADNPSSSAYGIPQALPGSKMSSAGADWADNPATQITWGLGYIQDRYGSPCSAWGHSQSYNWY